MQKNIYFNFYFIYSKFSKKFQAFENFKSMYGSSSNLAQDTMPNAQFSCRWIWWWKNHLIINARNFWKRFFSFENYFNQLLSKLTYIKCAISRVFLPVDKVALSDQWIFNVIRYSHLCMWRNPIIALINNHHICNNFH